MTHRIVVVGAGYAGLAATTRLARRTRGRDVSIDLVNAGPSFVERIRLHQLAAGTGDVTRPLTEILAGTSVRLHVDRVTGLDPVAHTVTLAGAAPGDPTLGYDTLVYALGSHAAVGTVPGVAEHAYSLDGTEQSGRLAAAVSSAKTLVVCGGGLTGVEAATEFAEAHPGLSVTLVTRGEVGHSVSPRARDHLRTVLDRLGVRLLERTDVTRVTAAAVECADGQSLPAEVTLWCGAFAVPTLAADAGLAADAEGRLVVDARLRSVSHPDVYGVGDATSIPLPSGPQRMSCQAGMPAGLYAADTIATALAGGDPKPFRFRYLLQCVSLGRRDALVQVCHGDDSPARPVITGRAAVTIKETICRSAAWATTSGAIPATWLYPLPQTAVDPQTAGVTG